ncbi:MAG: RecX family transcriptional regulator [Clostridia bacterium]|nr:RecX family transcriptional regulator [Clostridia bacterium]
MYSLEDFDKAKTKILKYIVYKKRTEQEVRQKFQKEFDDEMFEDIIEYLKDAKYIDDKEYIEKIINNFMVLKNLSNKELKYKLMVKGIERNLIEDYFYENKEELEEYEIKSATNIILKKTRDMEKDEIKMYLLKKGYKQSSINSAYGGS